MTLWSIPKPISFKYQVFWVYYLVNYLVKNNLVDFELNLCLNLEPDSTEQKTYIFGFLKNCTTLVQIAGAKRQNI